MCHLIVHNLNTNILFRLHLLQTSLAVGKCWFPMTHSDAIIKGFISAVCDVTGRCEPVNLITYVLGFLCLGAKCADPTGKFKIFISF